MIQFAKAEEKRKEIARVVEAKKTTVQDLTTGILCYKKLGLDFQRTGDDELKLIFTYLDPDDPKRPFEFVLTSTTDGFQVEDCDPPLRVQTLMTLVKDLNEAPDENFSYFMSRMRIAFQETITM